MKNEKTKIAATIYFDSIDDTDWLLEAAYIHQHRIEIQNVDGGVCVSLDPAVLLGLEGMQNG